MTQFGFRIRFDDSETQTLQRALSHYLEVCQREIKKGGDAPFTADRGTLKRFRAKSKEVLKLTQSFAVHENDMDMVRHALKSYLEACEREVANGATMPFIADKVVIPKIRAALEDELERATISTSLRWAARKQL
jgi:hypothetical protein